MGNTSELAPRQRAARIKRLNRLAMEQAITDERNRVYFGDDYKDKEEVLLDLGHHDLWHLFLMAHRLTDGMTFEPFDAYGDRAAALDSVREKTWYEDYAVLAEIDGEMHFREHGEYPKCSPPDPPSRQEVRRNIRHRDCCCVGTSD